MFLLPLDSYKIVVFSIELFYIESVNGESNFDSYGEFPLRVKGFNIGCRKSYFFCNGRASVEANCVGDAQGDNIGGSLRAANFHFEARSSDSNFLRDVSYSIKRNIQKECSAQSTLSEFWDTYLALGAELRDVVTAFERRQQSQIAEREAWKAQANVSPYMMYAMERQWACRDNTYEFVLDGEIGGFTLWQLCGARDDTETANADGLVW